MPDSPSPGHVAMLQSAQRLFDARDDVRALEAVDESLGLSPDFYRSVFFRAKILRRLGRPEWLETLERAVTVGAPVQLGARSTPRATTS